MRPWIQVIIFFFLVAGCQTSRTLREAKPNALPQPPREFRAAWVASVANINWPSQPGLSVQDQKQEAIRLLDLLAEHHYNAVILQVRPQCDALYQSTLEPWSYYLTGAQGVAPDPFYDPLKFWIEQAHQRGLELHAWLNPYRAHHTSSGKPGPQSLVNRKADLAIELENGFWWLDPADPSTQEHSFQVTMDIVDRYDVDGIHFDDYFYPYPSYNEGEDFPDDRTWKSYRDQGGKLARADWRRDAVNQFIQRVYQGIKKKKPFVKFGLSPFGIWRPGHPPSIRGFDQFANLYADAKLWLEEGWLDYWTPQLYWPINQIEQSFPILLRWWQDQNKKKRPIWPGLSIGRKKGTEGVDEVINQIMVARGMLPEQLGGTVHWSIGPLMQSDTLIDALYQGPYRDRALIPTMHHLSRTPPKPPTFQHSNKDDQVVLQWSVAKTEISHWLLYAKYGSTWSSTILPGTTPSWSLSKTDSTSQLPLTNVALVSVNRYGLVSDASFLAGWE